MQKFFFNPTMNLEANSLCRRYNLETTFETYDDPDNPGGEV